MFIFVNWLQYFVVPSDTERRGGSFSVSMASDFCLRENNDVNMNFRGMVRKHYTACVWLCGNRKVFAFQMKFKCCSPFTYLVAPPQILVLISELFCSLSTYILLFISTFPFQKQTESLRKHTCRAIAHLWEDRE